MPDLHRAELDVLVLVQAGAQDVPGGDLSIGRGDEAVAPQAPTMSRFCALTDPPDRSVMRVVL